MSDDRDPPHNELTLTNEMIDRCCEIVEQGNFRLVARQMIGVPLGTWKGWLRRGKAELERLADGYVTEEQLTLKAHLVRRLDESEAKVHSKLIANIVDNADPKTQLQYLKLRHGALYNSNPNKVLDDDTGEETLLVTSEALEDKIKSIIEEMRRERGEANVDAEFK